MFFQIVRWLAPGVIAGIILIVILLVGGTALLAASISPSLSFDPTAIIYAKP